MPKRKRGLNRRGETMVRQVFRVTLEQLAAVGFERLSVPEVAAQAGVNKTSVYRRWPKKGVLVREALGSALGEPPDFVETGDLRTDLLAWGRGSLAFARSPVGQAVFRALLSADSPALRPFATQLLQATTGPLGVLKRARRRGELRPGVNLELALSTIAGALLHRLHVERRDADDEVLTQLVDLVLDGVRR
jgi:AcrR family transcriptional regulator